MSAEEFDRLNEVCDVVESLASAVERTACDACDRVSAKSATKEQAVEGMRAALAALRDYLTRELEEP